MLSNAFDFANNSFVDRVKFLPTLSINMGAKDTEGLTAYYKSKIEVFKLFYNSYANPATGSEM